MSRWRGAIVGLGNVALNGHVPGWKSKPDFEITAGVDSSPERRKLFLEAYPGAKAFGALEEALASKIPFEFVDIATPPHTHSSIIKTALRSGRNVLCEKPLVLNSKELDEIRWDAQEAEKILMTVHNWKYSPICRKIAERLDQKTVGEITRIEWYVLRSGPSITTEKDNWRLNPKMSGGGILVDHGWHAFYLILEWLKAQPKAVQCTLENRQYEDLPVEDTAKVRIDFNGQSAPAAVEIFVTWASRLRKNSGLIEGTEGRITMEDDHLIVEKKGAAPEKIDFPAALSAGSHHPDWFGFVADEFKSELDNSGLAGRNFGIAQTVFQLMMKARESSEKREKVSY